MDFSIYHLQNVRYSNVIVDSGRSRNWLISIPCFLLLLFSIIVLADSFLFLLFVPSSMFSRMYTRNVGDGSNYGDKGNGE